MKKSKYKTQEEEMKDWGIITRLGSNENQLFHYPCKTVINFNPQLPNQILFYIGLHECEGKHVAP